MGVSRCVQPVCTVTLRWREINARIALCLLFLFLGGVNGCTSVAYYQQAVSGQMALLMQREPILEVLADPAVPPAVKAKLRYVQSALQYADDAGLPVEGSYGDYVDLGRTHVVWNVYAAPEFSLQPRTFCYLVVGCMAYKGFFTEVAARELAAGLDAEGLDTWVGGVAAYSTLGWFDDPVLSSFVGRTDARLAALLFHELAHKVVFVKGDTAFNEGFATAVERILLREWLASRGEQPAFESYLASNALHEAFIKLVFDERSRLVDLYASGGPTAELRRGKALIIADLRSKYRDLAAAWSTDPYGGWMAAPINNARLATMATYNEYVPAFRMLYAEACSLQGYFERVEVLAGLDAESRRSRLLALLAEAQVTRR